MCMNYEVIMVREIEKKNSKHKKKKKKKKKLKKLSDHFITRISGRLTNTQARQYMTNIRIKDLKFLMFCL